VCLVTSWTDHIEHNICCKARKLTGMRITLLYIQFYAWADTSTMLHIYFTWIHPASSLRVRVSIVGPLHNPGIQSLESVQKIACKVCLKQWDNIWRIVGPYTFITMSKAFVNMWRSHIGSGAVLGEFSIFYCFYIYFFWVQEDFCAATSKHWKGH